MRGGVVVLVAGLLSTTTDAIHLHKRTDGPQRVVSFPLHRRAIPDLLSRDRLRRRSETVPVTLANEETLYFANASLGTPPQELHLHVDTGSSDLWVNTPTSIFCSGLDTPCAEFGTYKANSSSSYSYISSNFNISYVDGTGSSGDYASDTITIGGTTLPQLQFGIGYESSSPEAILGVGYQANEVQVGRAGGAPYNNLPAQLVADEKISSNAFSLWLNDLDANTGSILFGGVDTDQYHGSLETLPIQQEGGEFAEFFITLTGLTLGSTTAASDQALAVLLDSGSSLTYLPSDMTQIIYNQVGAQYNSTTQVAWVPCSLASSSNTLDFTFSSPTISISMNELVLPISSGPGGPTLADGVTPACIFGISPNGGGTSALGDTFLRSTYVVYDLSNNEISIAATNFNATSSNIVEIGTGKSSVPGATAVANSAPATSGVNNPQGGTVILGPKKNGATQQNPPATLLGAMAVIGAGVLYGAM